MPGALILVVDDDADIRITLACGLELAGFRVISAGDGRQALHAIAREAPALVLLDMGMPVLDGRGFARELARLGQHLRIIVITSDPNIDAFAAEVGAVAALSKPFALPRLLSEVETVLQAA